MRVSVTQELLIFLAMTVMGIAEGLIFDIFRIVRKNTLKNIVAVGISDLIYWIIAAIFFAAVVLRYTDGALRGYMFVAVILGLIFYFFLLSRPIIFIFMGIIDIFLKIFKLIFKILLTPLVFLYKMLLEPFCAFTKKFFCKLQAYFEEKYIKFKKRKKNGKKT